MTSQQQADEALAMFQLNRNSPEIEALMDQFFGFPTQDQYDRTLSRVSEAMSCPVTTKPLSSSPAPSLSA